jgi:16S rRNA (uracil1498-N3)-methyltransferase
MHRFYVPPNEWQSGNKCLHGREAHHALHVLRVRRGESVTVLDGEGGEFLCEVQETRRDEVGLKVTKANSIAPRPCQVTLLQAIPKGKILEAIIQKATELCAARIVPLLSERVVTQLDQEEAVAKAAKYQSVAIEAIKQCGAAWLPMVETPVRPADFLRRKESYELPLVASLHGERAQARKYFDHFKSQYRKSPHSVCVWVGPEGDFSPDEIEMIKSSGAFPITLGPLVLRSETAAVYCLSIINHELQSSDGAPQT